MADNPLSSLIQLCLLIFVIWSILAGMFVVINHKLISTLLQDNSTLLQDNSTLLQDNSTLLHENKELREALAKYQQPQQPEWVQWLFDDAPSDPRISALN